MFWLVSAAGYNNVEVAEFLLENGADVNAQDKGGLIPLHNASSYGVRKFYYLHPEKFFMLFCRLLIFFKINFFRKILSGIPSVCQTDWIQIRPEGA